MAKKGPCSFLSFFPSTRGHFPSEKAVSWSPSKTLGKIVFLPSGSPVFAEMAHLLNSILTVIKVFQKYAKEDEDCTLLCKEELKHLLLAEFGNILRVRRRDSGPHGVKGERL